VVSPRPPAGGAQAAAIGAREAAARFSITTRTLRRWARSGLLPPVRIGHGPRPTVRYRLDDVEALLHPHRAEARP
jgi:DNA-binding transcriptional MerR regulator